MISKHLKPPHRVRQSQVATVMHLHLSTESNFPTRLRWRTWLKPKRCPTHRASIPSFGREAKTRRGQTLSIRITTKRRTRTLSQKSLRTSAKGSGAGMTGFRFEFLCPLLRASADEWLPFENLAVAIGTGEVPAWVREVLSLERATALKKGSDGIRPLVCHEPLRRLLTRALVFAAGENIQSYLGPHQFAVGIQGGCPAMACSVSVVLPELSGP